MSTQSYELFSRKLRDVFIGEKVTGNTGHINLLRIKNAYFTEKFEEIAEYIDRKSEQFEESDAIENRLFDDLYSFMKKYFGDDGSMYFSYTPLNEKIYDRVYESGEDVSLFWKTNMLYYVKTGDVWGDMEVHNMDVGGESYTVRFDTSSLSGRTGNQQKDIVFEVSSVTESMIVFTVEYSSYGMSESKRDEIRRELKRKFDIRVTNEQLREWFTEFEKQNTVDYFINKNAEGFLKEQFDLWIKQEILDLESSLENTEEVQYLTVLRDVGYEIIEFISQFEEELAKVWNKPRAVRGKNYLLTVSAANQIVDNVVDWMRNGDWAAQVTEWQELGVIEEEIPPEKAAERPQLVLDTQYFDTKRVEASIGCLSLDGRIVKSENYQALQSLSNVLQDKIDAVYIDPPYNSKGTSEIAYLNNFNHATWLSLMENRLSLASDLLKDTGALVCAIDENEQHRLGLLLEELFPSYTQDIISVLHNPRGKQGDNFTITNEFAYFVYPDSDYINTKEIPEEDWEYSPLRNWGGESKREDGPNCFYPIYVENGEVTSIGAVPDSSHHPDERVETVDSQTFAVWPIDSNGVERKWRYDVESIKNNLHRLTVDGSGDDLRIKIAKTEEKFTSVWSDSKYDASTYGTRYLSEIGLDEFTFPKSIHTVTDSLYAVCGDNPNASILDFFAGSGTTAEATLRLNNRDNGNRDFTLVEMDSQFENTIIPRLKLLPNELDIDSLFVSYYKLEQYETVLQKSEYASDTPLDTTEWENYMFLSDERLATDTVTDSDDGLEINLQQLYDDIDIPETLALLYGEPVSKVTDEAVHLDDGTHISLEDPPTELVRPLLWWGDVDE